MQSLAGLRRNFRLRWLIFALHVTADLFIARSGRRDWVTEGSKTIIDVTSEFGIDNAMIRRKSEDWPESMFVRLHLLLASR